MTAHMVFSYLLAWTTVASAFTFEKSHVALGKHVQPNFNCTLKGYTFIHLWLTWQNLLNFIPTRLHRCKSVSSPYGSIASLLQ